MDHRALITSLSDQTKAKLQRRSDAVGLKHLALHFALITACTAAIATKAPLWPLLILPQGVLLVFLFTLCHECTHKTPFRSGWLNEVVGHLVSIPIALPFTWFRYYHMAHHKWTNDPERDPELDGKPRPDKWRSFLIYLSGWLYWSAMAKTLLMNAVGRIDAPYLPRRQHRAIRIEARLLLALYAAAGLSLFFSPLLLWIWILPVMVGQPALRLCLLAEHGLCPPVSNMFENSRTTFTSRILRLLTWNMSYHAEHHAFPNVPFHHLPALHREARTHLKTTSDGYSTFTAEYLRTLDL